MNMKVSIGVAAALLLGLAFSPTLGGYAPLGQAAICAVAFAAAVQAARADRNLWVIGLAAIALVFNPLFTVAVPPPLVLWTIAGAIAIQIGWIIAYERAVAPQTVADVLHPKGLVK
jgi:Family of unknown function (DUF6804)